MRTLLVSHYFPPEVGAPQVRLSTLARTWAGDGDAVTVLTGMPNYPTGVVSPPYQGALRRLERQDGYRVVAAGSADKLPGRPPRPASVRSRPRSSSSWPAASR